MKKRIALYPGTFDPITNGHLDIIRRAMRLCDHLVIGVARNEAKAPLFSVTERVVMVQEEVQPMAGIAGVQVSVEPFEMLLMHFAERVGAAIIVRGLRAVSDFEYEFQMVGMNMQINPKIETVFLMADGQHQAVASRLVKEICALGGDIQSFVTPSVAAKLMYKYKDRRAAMAAELGSTKVPPALKRPNGARAGAQTIAASRRVPGRRRPDRPR